MNKFNQNDNYEVQAPKFAILSGDISEPSDVNGIARFKNLTIEFMTTTSFYLYFSCDNVINLIWGPRLITDYIPL